MAITGLLTTNPMKTPTTKKTRKVKHNECYLDVEPYRRKLYLYHGGKADFLARMKEVFNTPDELVDQVNDAKGATFRIKNEKKGQDFITIWIGERSYDNISHEIFHLTETIMSHAGVRLSEDSEEAWAYLNGWLNDKVMTWIFSLPQD